MSKEDILKYTPDIDYIDSVKTYENTFKKILKKYMTWLRMKIINLYLKQIILALQIGLFIII